MSTTLDEAAQFCQDSLPNCPIPLLRRLVVEAIRQFSKDSWIKTLWIPQALIVDGQAEYDLVSMVPAGYVIWDVKQVLVNGSPILPYADYATTPAVDQAPYMGGVIPNNSDLSFSNVTYNRATGNSITIVPTSTGLGGATLDVELVIMPAVGGTAVVPDIIWNEWAEAIENYVKWKAMTRPGEKFSNPEMGEFHRKEWLDYAAAARTKARQGNVTGRMRTTPSDFA